MKAVLDVHAMWDDEAHVWVATSEDVPGLFTEADTMEKLVDSSKSSSRSFSKRTKPVTGRRCQLYQVSPYG